MRVRTSEELGMLVKGARQKAGLSQQDVAGLAKVQRTWLSRLESGHANPTFETLVRVLAAVGLGVDAVSLDAPVTLRGTRGPHVDLVTLLNQLRRLPPAGADQPTALTKALITILLAERDRTFTTVRWPVPPRSTQPHVSHLPNQQLAGTSMLDHQVMIDGSRHRHRHRRCCDRLTNGRPLADQDREPGALRREVPRRQRFRRTSTSLTLPLSKREAPSGNGANNETLMLLCVHQRAGHGELPPGSRS